MKNKQTLSQCRKALKQSVFLEHFQRAGILSIAAGTAGVSRQTVYYWKRTSPSFVSRMMKAQDEFEQTGDGYRLAAISTLAQAGDRYMQKYIRKEHGEKELKAVMRGKNLKWKGSRI